MRTRRRQKTSRIISTSTTKTELARLVTVIGASDEQMLAPLFGTVMSSPVKKPS